VARKGRLKDTRQHSKTADGRNGLTRIRANLVVVPRIHPLPLACQPMKTRIREKGAPHDCRCSRLCFMLAAMGFLCSAIRPISWRQSADKHNRRDCSAGKAEGPTQISCLLLCLGDCIRTATASRGDCTRRKKESATTSLKEEARLIRHLSRPRIDNE
jgi:hypothetical protein